MRSFADFTPDTIMIVVQAAHPDYQPALYLPPKRWLHISVAPGGPKPTTENFVAQVKQKLLDHLEKYRAIPLTPVEWGEQVFLLRDSCLSFKVTTLEKVEELLAEIEESEMQMPGPSEESFEDVTPPTESNGTTDAGVEITAIQMADDDPGDQQTESTMDEARAMLAEERAEREGEEDDEDDIAPPWGQPEQSGPKT